METAHPDQIKHLVEVAQRYGVLKACDPCKGNGCEHCGNKGLIYCGPTLARIERRDLRLVSTAGNGATS